MNANSLSSNRVKSGSNTKRVLGQKDLPPFLLVLIAGKREQRTKKEPKFLK
jgi:hypothetical protein